MKNFFLTCQFFASLFEIISLIRANWTRIGPQWSTSPQFGQSDYNWFIGFFKIIYSQTQVACDFTQFSDSSNIFWKWKKTLIVLCWTCLGIETCLEIYPKLSSNILWLWDFQFEFTLLLSFCNNLAIFLQIQDWKTFIMPRRKTFKPEMSKNKA